jgi:antitoxin ParD1/3/4
MDDINITLPESMKSWIERQAELGQFMDASDYVRDLIRKDQDRVVKIEAMQRLVDEGLESGLSDENMDDILRSMNSAAE